MNDGGPGRSEMSSMEKIDWMANYDPEVGLWWATRSPAHTQELAHLGMKVHPGPDAASRLILAAQRGELAEVPVERVLEMLSKMRSEKEPGLLCWYWEEDGNPSDPNANFFTGLGLIALWLGYRAALPPSASGLLFPIFGDLLKYFSHAVEDERFHYLNAYMGEIVCAWLLSEILDECEGRGRIEAHMRRSAHYWLNHRYGFGEHMSDIYCRVALQQVSVLLLFAQQLPDDIRRGYMDVFHDLLLIEDAYDDGPRVPAIRNYSLLESPLKCKNGVTPVTNYRDRIIPIEQMRGVVISNNPPLEGLLHKAGWHKIASPRKPPSNNVSISCYDGALASAWIEPDIRMGSMTRSPIMPGTENRTSGLSWQSFPVVFWRPEGDWGFLQWQITQDGRASCHPAEGHAPSQRGNPLTNILPPIVGRTYSIQHGGDLIVLRIMPAVDSRWSGVTDRLRVIDSHADVVEIERVGGWRQLLLKYPGREVAIQHVTLMETPEPSALVRRHDGKATDWEFSHDKESLNRLAAGLWRTCIGLWAISLAGRVEEPPKLTLDLDAPTAQRLPEERLRRLDWKWRNVHWQLRIDAFHSQPLLEVCGGNG